MSDQQPEIGSLERSLARLGKPLALGQLAPGVVHEINNPLFAILGLLEFVLAEVEPGTRLRERLELVVQSGEEIRDLMRALLDFAREQPDERVRLALDEVASGAVALFRRTSLARDVETELAPSPPACDVTGSRIGLKLVFLNLLTNAQQAMEGRGTVRVSLAREADEITAAVADSGPGVPPELRERVFEPFFTTHAERGAPGLGLTIARAIARLHGGDLVLAPPQEAGGACFVLRLPAAP